jgi:hypothetical protein
MDKCINFREFVEYLFDDERLIRKALKLSMPYWLHNPLALRISPVR